MLERFAAFWFVTVESVDGRCGIEGADVDVLVVVEVVVGCDAVGMDVD